MTAPRQAKRGALWGKWVWPAGTVSSVFLSRLGGSRFVKSWTLAEVVTRGDIVLNRVTIEPTARWLVTATETSLRAWRSEGDHWVKVAKRAGGAALFPSALGLRQSAAAWLEWVIERLEDDEKGNV